MGTEYRHPTPGDFDVAPGKRETDSGRNLQAKVYAGKLKNLADTFDKLANSAGINVSEQVKVLIESSEVAGRLVIEAYQNGFLRNVPNLRETIAWHTADRGDDPTPGPGGPQTVYVRCPGNLFRDIVGCATVTARITDGRGTDVKTAQGDGILPGLSPAAFSSPVHALDCENAGATFAAESLTRRAEACRFLAELIHSDEGDSPRVTVIKSEDEVPPEYRDAGLPDGEPLTAKVISEPAKYGLSKAYLSKQYQGPRLKLGKEYIYRHKEIAALAERKSHRADRD